MPVIVLTTIEPPPPPPTGFGGKFVLPVDMYTLMISGSLRAPDDTLTLVGMINMDHNSISGSLRAPDDTLTLVGMINMDVTGVVDTIVNKDNIAIDNPVTASVITGSPDIGVV